MSEPSFPLIDHPSQPGWRDAGYEVMSQDRIDALVTRFPDYSPEKIVALTELLGRLSVSVDASRQTYEATTIGLLELSQKEYKRYKSLAGRRETIGEFIHWFSVFSDEFFLHADSSRTAPKIGLEIGGSRLGGDWEFTLLPEGLDETIETIPDKIKEQGHETIIDIHYSRGAIKRYGFDPHYTREHSFEVGVARRKRSVADVSIGDSKWPLKIYKVSEFAILMDELSSTERVKIERGVMAVHAEQGKAKEDSHSKAKEDLYTATGPIVERAITPSNDLTRDTIPLGAHYVMFKDAKGSAKGL